MLENWALYPMKSFSCFGSQIYSCEAGHKFPPGLVCSGREAVMSAGRRLGRVCAWISWNHVLLPWLSRKSGLGKVSRLILEHSEAASFSHWHLPGESKPANSGTNPASPAFFLYLSWLLRDSDMRLRTTYKGFTEAVDLYFDHLMSRVVPLQVKASRLCFDLHLSSYR